MAKPWTEEEIAGATAKNEVVVCAFRVWEAVGRPDDGPEADALDEASEIFEQVPEELRAYVIARSVCASRVQTPKMEK